MTTVLVIEDEKNIRLFVVANLEARAYKVLEAETGVQGLGLMRSVFPDVIILDMNLTDMTGADVLFTMSQDDTLKTLPVILMSAAIDTSDVDTYHNVVQRVVKPASIKTLLDAVQKITA